MFTIGSSVLYCSVCLWTAPKRKSHIYKYSKEKKHIHYVTYKQEEQIVIRERLLIDKTEYTDLTYVFISHSYSQSEVPMCQLLSMCNTRIQLVYYHIMYTCIAKHNKIIQIPHCQLPSNWPRQYRHLIPAPVDRTSASAWLYKHLWISCQTNNPSTSMTSVDCEPKLRSVVRTFKHPCPGNWVGIGRAVVYYVWAAHAFSAWVKCWQCRLILQLTESHL